MSVFVANHQLEIVKAIDVASPVTENVFIRQIKNAAAQDIKTALEAIVQALQEIKSGGVTGLAPCADVTFGGDKPILAAGSFPGGSDYKRRFIVPGRSLTNFPRWCAYLNDREQVRSWDELDTETRAKYRQNYPRSAGHRHPTALTLSALSVEGGTIRLDPGDVISLPAAALELHDFAVEYVSEPETDAANTLFELTGELSEANRAALVRAMDRARGTDTYTQVVVEKTGGVTRVKTVKKSRASALTDETAWQGASSDGWATDANWSANVIRNDVFEPWPDNGTGLSLIECSAVPFPSFAVNDAVLSGYSSFS